MKQYISMAAGSSVKNLNKDKVYDVIIPLPPLSEQRAIAEVLGKVDALIANLAKRIEKKRLVREGVMHDLLTGKKRLPGFAGEWKTVKLGECGELTKGSGISRAESDSGNIPAVRYGEIYTHHNDYVKDYVSHISLDVAKRAKLLSKGDVLFAGSGETEEDIGKAVAVLDDGVYAGGDLIVFSPFGDSDPIFIGTLLNMPYVQKQKTLCAQGATVIHITSTSIAGIEIYLPEYQEQRAIAGVLSGMDGEIAQLEAKREKYAKIKAGLMNDLLTGKVRVR